MTAAALHITGQRRRTAVLFFQTFHNFRPLDNPAFWKERNDPGGIQPVWTDFITVYAAGAQIKMLSRSVSEKCLFMFAGGYKNWHKENIDETLKALTRLGGEAGN